MVKPRKARALPPFWAQADSGQIMTWTRQIRLIWMLASPRGLDPPVTR
jgi:hypothetical protein